MTHDEQEAQRGRAFTRGEFEDFRGGEFKQVLLELQRINSKLDDQAEKRQWNLPTIIAVVAVLGAPLVFTIKNLYQGEQTAEALASHLQFSDRKAAELDRSDVDLRAHFDAEFAEIRERVRALESANVENETQHRWLADVMNLRADLNHQLERARVEDGRIVYPDQSYWPLQGIGGVPQNSHR